MDTPTPPPATLVGQNGHIIALEGPSDAVSTQLRLLPTSRCILVLPDLQHYILRDTNDEEAFSASKFIRRTHKASEARRREAQEFLRQSTAGEARFVFTHGGTVGAQAQCLSAIANHITNGNLDEASDIFNSLTSSGMDGLEAQENLAYQKASFATWEERVTDSRLAGLRPTPLNKSKQPEWNPAKTAESHLDMFEDPIIRAMRAADALDKETEFLQPANHDVDLTVKMIEIKKSSPKRSRSLSEISFSEQEALLFNNIECPAEKAPPKIPLRKRPLRIHIPTPSLTWKGDAEGLEDEQVSPTNQSILPSSSVILGEKRPRTAETCTARKLEQRMQVDWGMFEKWGQKTEPEPEPEPEPESAPLPVLPLHENLIIYLSGKQRDEGLSLVFHGFRLGDYPDRVLTEDSNLLETTNISRKTSSCGSRSRDGKFDSWESSWGEGALIHGLLTPSSSPTPSTTRTLTTPEMAQRLHRLDIENEAPASLQNLLRSLLCSRFPIQNCEHGEPPSPRRSGAKDSWQPLHCGVAKASCPKGPTRIDMILAIGAEAGVNSQYLSGLAEKIEKLGCKRSNASRSGRLNLRSLIASAMQSFTAQPLTRQCHGNPFSDRSLLAALIVPHLETYLHTHPDVHLLLIEYPAEHLGTILALQELIGIELMKVVGILNGDGDGSTLMRPLTAPPRPGLTKTAIKSRFQNEFGDRVRALMGACSFSKANFLLASSATQAETAAFIAAIREILISISDFYIPETPLYPLAPLPDTAANIRAKRRPTLSIPRSSSTSQLSSSEPQPPCTATSRLDTPPESPAESYSTADYGSLCVARYAVPAVSKRDRIPRTHIKSNKITDRLRWGNVSYATSLASHSRLTKSATAAAGVARDMYISDDEDEEEDEEERRLMPLYFKRQVQRGSSIKAMKLLGLV
ncbi:hypothetical protein QBC42DRAFT_230604 [Cladorrhinum samala]|uniref:Uncharacterized protein n=1 Tax=Cladorrhinum samala TaxID=585594 RepID=A0AAV9HHH2_9PEZI|nr:hypothetical protein QBC42DRAFT_230604 [Cladorrhinum samala]